MPEKTNNTQPLLTSLPPSDSRLRIIPLGGLGEFGMNSMLLEFGGEMILVDCGQMMPDSEMPGVDYVIPDMTFLHRNIGALKAIVITHAHEDHIGALPFVLPELPGLVPLFTSEFTAALLKEKLSEYRIQPNFQIYEPRHTYRLGKHFEFEPLAVTHSTADCYALAIRTPIGVVIHSGDYKIDPAPPDGVAFDHYRFSQYAEGSEEGVLLLMSDSTNVDRKGTCPSEAEVIAPLRRLIREAEGSVIFGCFSSAVHRIQNVMNLAAEMGRTVFASGLNMDRTIRVARELGILEVRCDFREDLRGWNGVPRNRRLVLTTGSQGEPMSALSRMALGTHKHVSVENGDTVILSSRMIPGNEKAIYKLINNLARAGATVHDERSTPGIHVSGHAYQDDMRHLINMVNPTFLMPIHGEYRQLLAHRRLALELGMREDEVLLANSGECIELTAQSIEVIGRIPHGRVLVDGKGIGDVGEEVLRDRHHLSQDGIVFVSLAVDSETGEVLSGPDILSRGFIHEDENLELLEEARNRVLSAVAEACPQGREEITAVQAAVKKELRRFFKERTERFPMIHPVILEA